MTGKTQTHRRNKVVLREYQFHSSTGVKTGFLFLHENKPGYVKLRQRMSLQENLRVLVLSVLGGSVRNARARAGTPRREAPLAARKASAGLESLHRLLCLKDDVRPVEITVSVTHTPHTHLAKQNQLLHVIIKTEYLYYNMKGF